MPEFYIDVVLLDDFVVKEDDPLAYATLPVPNETLDETFCNRPTGQPYRKGDPYRRETQALEMKVVQFGIYLLIWIEAEHTHKRGGARIARVHICEWQQA